MYDTAELCTRGFLVYVGPRRGAFVVGYSGERDSGVKWEKTSVRPSMSTFLDLLTQACRTVTYKSHKQQLLNSYSVNCIYN
jgi:hypothetical protein